jgi:alpha-1,6-rhamnosyltransferase
MTTPLISVRMPAYNHERYVAKALDSVLVQDYPNKEIVIIDDGSEDRTSEEIEAWIEAHGHEIPIKFHSRENQGIAATINELILMAEGEFIAGLATDDYLLPGSLSARYQWLSAHPQKLAVFADCQVVDAEGEVIFASGLTELHRADKSRYLTDRGLRREIICNWSVPGSTIMVRRELHERFRYDESLQVEDRDFYLRMVSQNLLGFLDLPVTGYRLHENNTCFAKSFRLTASKSKLRSLVKNRGRFPLRDQLLFVGPILSAAAGVLVYSAVELVNSKMESKSYSL